MNNFEDEEFKNAYQNWVEQIEHHQRHIFIETAKIVNLMKHKKVSTKTKKEIIIIVKGLQATVKSVSKVLMNHVK